MTEHQREYFNPAGAIQGGIRVLSVTTSASSEQSLTEFATERVELKCDVPFWITFGVSTVTDPDETATSGNGRTFRVEAGEPYHVHVVAGTNDKFKVKGVGAGTLRWYVYNG